MVIESLLGISLSANIALAILCFLLRKKPQIVTQKTLDAAQILNDLTSGPSLIKVERIDGSDLFIRGTK